MCSRFLSRTFWVSKGVWVMGSLSALGDALDRRPKCPGAEGAQQRELPHRVGISAPVLQDSKWPEMRTGAVSPI